MNNTGLEGEEEPRRGASRANSVRFDESAIHGYYGQNRSSSELPLRTGSGMDSHPLTERSLSHRSDGRLSSSGHSHHSARTNSLGLEGSKLIPSASGSPSNITAPPGLFLLGPLPCIIRCWLTTSFSNDSLLYAAVCSGSYSSFLGFPLIEKLGLEEQIAQKGNMRFIKLRLYLPEASIHPASSRASSPIPQLPTLTIRFLVRETDPSDKSIQILIGSDVLRSHNADILFSQEKIIMIDDERKRVSIPLVRPENDSAFKSLSTASEASRPASSAGCNGNEHSDTNGDIAGVIARPPAISPQQSSTSPTLRASGEAFDGIDKPPSTHSEADHDDSNSQSTHTKSVVDSESTFATPAKQENAGVWGGSWRRDSKLDSNAVGMARSTRGRSMKVLRPSKSTSSRVGPGASSNASTVSDVVSSPAADSNRQPRQLSPINPPETLHPTPSRSASLNSGDSLAKRCLSVWMAQLLSTGQAPYGERVARTRMRNQQTPVNTASADLSSHCCIT